MPSLLAGWLAGSHLLGTIFKHMADHKWSTAGVMHKPPGQGLALLSAYQAPGRRKCCTEGLQHTANGVVTACTCVALAVVLRGRQSRTQNYYIATFSENNAQIVRHNN
jgi:hypothetical protein